MTNDGRGTAVAAPKKQQPNTAIIQWKGEAITITFHDVKNLICPLATDQEAAVFLKTCQSLQLNPFANECFLIKYDAKDKAATVIAIDAYLKAAEVNDSYDGCEAGIILKGDSGKLNLREGAFLLDEERPKLVGGWAKVFRKDREHSTYVAVNKAECVKLTREGRPTQFWTEPKQPWMLRKTALKRALVEAFPSLFAGTLATAEVAPDAEYRVVEGELPAAFESNGEPDWSKFWVKASNELGLTSEQVHGLLDTESVKDLIERGWTMEQAWEELVKALRESKAPTKALPSSVPRHDDIPEPLFDDHVGESIVDFAWLKQSLQDLQWADVPKYLKAHYLEAQGETVKQMIESLTREHQEEFVAEVKARANMEVKWA